LPTEQQEPLTIAISSDGQVALQSTKIDRGDLVSKLRAVAAERTDNKVFLRADGSVSYAIVMEIMGALNAGGFNDIGLVTDAGGPRLDGSDQ
jgi:biopolymer transport protein TolR